MTTTRTCIACHATKTVAEFPKDRMNWRRICRVCFRLQQIERYRRDKHRPEFKAKRKESLRKHDLKSNYGITPEQYDAMIDAQGAVCFICKIPKRQTLHVDHCHTTGRVRKLLCVKCNQGLGYFNDDPAMLRAAAAYIEAHQ